MKSVSIFEVSISSPEKILLLGTLSEEEAKSFTKTYYSAMGSICDIFQYERTPIDHTKKRKEK